MSKKEIVRRAIDFKNPARIPLALPEECGTDFAGMGMKPSPDARPRSGVDEWGCVWENIGISNLGEVKKHPLADWKDLDRLKIPDITSQQRWDGLDEARERAGDRFIIAGGISLYERIHFLRGLNNTWVDIHTAPGDLMRLIDVLVDMNLYAIGRFADAGADGYMWCDDWGLQDRLMISPAKWRELWKPRYARVYAAAHEAGLRTFLHSCGDITSILDDFIEIGLDVIQIDQQDNMGVERLGREFGGRICFWCPVDIQTTMAHGSPDEIRAACRRLVENFGRTEGGFMARWYGDPEGAGHSPEAIDAMCEEFLRIAGLPWHGGQGTVSTG